MTTACHVFLFTLFTIFYLGNAHIPSIPKVPPPPRVICPSAVFTFGDSLLDVGNLCSDLEYHQAKTCAANHLPYGMSLVGGPNGRWSNGLVLTDYLIQSLRISSSDMCSSSFYGSYFRGINYAYSGATVTENATLGKQGGPSHTLHSQILQFLSYKYILEKGWGGTQHRHLFSNSLYVIQMGGEDLNYATGNQTIGLLGGVEIIPRVVSGLRDNILRLYQNGARHFLLLGMPATGCLPLILRNMFIQSHAVNATNSFTLDLNGCSPDVNSLVQLFNAQTSGMMEGLRLNRTMQDANFMYFDFYSAHMHVVEAGSSMGFDSRGSPYSIASTRACCGRGDIEWNCVGGPELCGCAPGVSVCPNPNQYINWDGVHFTSRFYQLMATYISHGEYLYPKIPLLPGCAA